MAQVWPGSPVGSQGSPQNTRCLGHSWQHWWGSCVWSLQVTGIVGDAAAQLPELTDPLLAVGSPSPCLALPPLKTTPKKVKSGTMVNHEVFSLKKWFCLFLCSNCKGNSSSLHKEGDAGSGARVLGHMSKWRMRAFAGAFWGAVLTS